jgi:hypothetical protein
MAALGKRKLPEKLPACPSRFRDFRVIGRAAAQRKTPDLPGFFFSVRR